MEIIEMTCKNCGGKLTITKDSDQVICQHCGSEYLISFSENAISIKNLSEGIKGVQKSTDKTASELALKRIDNQLKTISQWIFKANAICGHFINPNIENYEFLSFSPIPWLKQIDYVIESEKSKIFKNKDYISKLEALRAECVKVIDTWKFLNKQYEYHRKIVSKL